MSKTAKPEPPPKLKEWKFKRQPIRVAMGHRKGETDAQLDERFKREVARKMKLCPPDGSKGEK